MECVCVFICFQHTFVGSHATTASQPIPTPPLTCRPIQFICFEYGREKKIRLTYLRSIEVFFIFTRFPNKDTRALPKFQKPGKKYFNGNVFFFPLHENVYFFPDPFYIYKYISLVFFFFLSNLGSTKARAVIFSTK